jgi:hypothetical protein
MRTENQIKRKLNELTVQLKSAELELSNNLQADPENVTRIHTLRSRVDQLEPMVTLLEWVLNEPTGNYHT